MLPRHPLIFKLTTIIASIILIIFLFFNRHSNVVINRRFIVVTDETSVGSLYEEFKYASEEQSTPTTTTTDLPTTTRPRFIINGESLHYQLKQGKCANDVYVIIYVHSGPENTERRRVIRNTWGKPEILKELKARVLFVMGIPENVNTQASVFNENELYKDILQSNFTDTYRNLTYKAVTSLRWVNENCKDVMYVLKTDDDIAVDIRRVVRLMHIHIEKKVGVDNVLLGYTWTHMNVDRNKSSKWYTSPEEFPDKFFLKYCSGSAYLMTPDVVEKFYKASRSTPFFWVDDYYVTGMLAHATNVTANSLNDRYVLENNADIKGLLSNDTKTRLVFIHSPSTNLSLHAWNEFERRWAYG